MPNWLQVRAQASPKEPVELLIYDEIGKNWWDDSGVGAKEFAEVLDAIPRDQEILVRIHCPGGSLFDGLAIYHQLQARRDRVTVRVDGLAASIASVIAMAGKSLEMPANAFLMIHNPWSLAIGDADDMRKEADDLDYFRGSLVGIYHAKTGLPTHEIEAAMDAETWMTGEDAHEMGYCDHCLEEKAIAAKFDLSRFRNRILQESTEITENRRSITGSVSSVTSCSTKDAGAHGVTRPTRLDSPSAPNGKKPQPTADGQDVRAPIRAMNSNAEALSWLDKIKALLTGPQNDKTTGPQDSAEVSELKNTISRQAQEITVLETAQAAWTTAKAELEKRIADLDKDLKAAQATIADPNGKIEELASIKAREIAAGQGTPALPATPSATPAAAGNNTGTATERCLAANAARKLKI